MEIKIAFLLGIILVAVIESISVLGDIINLLARL